MAEQTRRKAPGKQPISRHPLFPVTVALWFGAGFALASLAFTPSLGMAVRIALVLATAAIGGLLGLAIARRLAGPKQAPAEPEDRSDEASDGGNALWSELKSERRALVVTGDAAAVNHKPAPVIERDPRILDVFSVGVEGFDAGPTPPAETGESDCDASLAASPEPIEQALSSAAEAEPVPQDEPVEPSAAERIAGADLGELSHVELLERLALSLQRRNHQIATATPAPEASAANEATVAPMAGATNEAHGDRLGRPAAVQPQVGVEEADGPAIAFPGKAERRGMPRSAARVPAPSETDAQLAIATAVATEQQGPEASEKALRDALAALQRMSGSR